MYVTIKNSISFLISACVIKICLSDFDNIQDTCPATSGEKQTVFINGLPCKNPSTISPPDFKSSKLTQPGDTDNFYRSAVKTATASDFPGLNTLGLSVARTDLDIDGLVMPHSHPRASEMFFVEKGTVLAGFVDTKSNVFQGILNAGDVIVFPHGLLHFCFNMGFDSATAFSVLNSQNPGVVSISGAMFEPQNDTEALNMLVTSLVSLSKRGMLDDDQYWNQNATHIKFPSHFGR